MSEVKIGKAFLKNLRYLIKKLERKRFDIINSDLNFVYSEIEYLLTNYKGHKNDYLENVMEEKKNKLLEKL